RCVICGPCAVYALIFYRMRTPTRRKHLPRNMVPLTPTEERDQRLAQLLDDLSEQRRRGQAPDINLVAAQHPDPAAELRELWGAMLLADELTRSHHASPAWSASDGSGNPSLALQAGDALLSGKSFGDYELCEVIGRGGMGIVYKAHQRSLNRTVAL